MNSPIWVLKHLSAILLFVCIGLPAAGHTWLEVESEYLGNGCFRYRVGSRPSPMLKTIQIEGFAFAFTNGTQLSPNPDGWTNQVSATHMYWSPTNQGFWQVPPYDAVFEVCGPLTNYTVGLATVIMSLTIWEFSGNTPVYSGNIVGYWNAPALVPSSIATDAFEPSTLYTNQSFPDIKIEMLVRSGDAITGVKFKSEQPATFRLEGSASMQDWIGVAYLYGDSGSTNWNSNRDLRSFGNFFRLQYIGQGHIPFENLPPLNGSSLSAQVSRARKTVKTDVVAAPEQFNLKWNSESGKNYRIEVLKNGEPVWTRECKASSDTLITAIPRAGLPPFGMIRTTEIE